MKVSIILPVFNSARHIRGSLESLHGKHWEHDLGDERASEQIMQDNIRCLLEGDFRRHRPGDYLFDIGRSYREDGLPSASKKLV